VNREDLRGWSITLISAVRRGEGGTDVMEEKSTVKDPYLTNVLKQQRRGGTEPPTRHKHK